jgi:diketogulonate reductase-like aldo/keto reductase
VIAIPKAVRAAHLRENLAAASIELDAEALQAIDAALPPPDAATPLAMN